jgi:hypothetical protein
MVLPRFIIGDGVGRYEGNEKKMGRDMLLYTGAFFAGEPHTQLTLTAQRVIRVRKCPRPGVVQLYTIFGIPRGELRFPCTGSDIIRCPAAGAECEQGDGLRSNPPRRRMAVLDERTGTLDEPVLTASRFQGLRATGVRSG